MSRVCFAHTRVALVAGVALAGSAQATPLLWVGHLDDENGPVQSASVHYVLRHGDTVLEEDDVIPTLLDGDFVLEFEIPDSDTVLFSDLPLTLQIVANGQDFGPTALARNWPAVASAAIAGTARHALDARTLSNREVVARAEFVAGNVSVDVVHVTDFPSGFFDGDDGLALVPSARFRFVDGVLTLADGTLPVSGTLAAADLADGAVGSADLANNVVTSAKASAVPVAAIAADALRSNLFGGSQTRTTLYEITNANCANPLTLTTAATCTAVDDCSGANVRHCDGTCDVVGASAVVCDNALVGDLVFK